MPKTLRLLIVALSAALSISFLGPAATSQARSTTVAGIVIKGKIYDTWKAAGGTATFGRPVTAEIKVRVSGRNGYLQRFERGQVFYSSLGRQAFTYPSRVSLGGVDNERDALARYGFAPGVLLRSARLAGATKVSKLKLAAELKSGLIIDLRTPSVIAAKRDPKLPGVTNVNFPINPDAIYPRYVTDAARRAAFAQTLRAAAAAKGTVLIHCTAGKDRTGWAVAMIMYAIGASDAQVMSEYLRTSGTYAAKLQGGLDQAVASYGSIDAYLRTGLGLTDADFAALVAKFAGAR